MYFVKSVWFAEEVGDLFQRHLGLNLSGVSLGYCRRSQIRRSNRVLLMNLMGVFGSATEKAIGGKVMELSLFRNLGRLLAQLDPYFVR